MNAFGNLLEILRVPSYLDYEPFYLSILLQPGVFHLKKKDDPRKKHRNYFGDSNHFCFDVS
jgi:hypothetical protein